MKARKVSEKNPGALVLGCDQVLDHRGQLLSKPTSPDDAFIQLQSLRGDRQLWSRARWRTSPQCPA
jgi:septum formation protein